MSAPFTKRLQAKLNAKFLYSLNAREAMLVQQAFVAALKEEVEARFANAEAVKTPFALIGKPLVVAGLGSFKMRTRPARSFRGGAANKNAVGTRKLPARRLAFTAKWEPIL